MKILKESNNSPKEELPISFITDLISKGWDEVGYLKDAISAIGLDYNETAKIESLMQDLMDAYLVFIGQLEAHLHKEDYIETPKLEMDKKQDKMSDPKFEPELPEAEIEIEPLIDSDSEATSGGQIATSNSFKDLAISDTELSSRRNAEPPATVDEPFEFFVDFDEPDMSEPRLTDDELYGHEDSEFEHNRLRSLLS